MKRLVLLLGVTLGLWACRDSFLPWPAAACSEDSDCRSGFCVDGRCSANAGGSSSGNSTSGGSSGGSGSGSSSGQSSSGQSSSGQSSSTSMPAFTVTPRDHLMTVGFEHVCLRRGLEVHCQGMALDGRLGPSVDAGLMGLVTNAGLGDFSALAAGRAHTCGIRTDTNPTRSIWCWGSNSDGQLGGASGPGPVQVGAEGLWANVRSMWDHTCAVHTNGDGMCWGNNVFGQVAQGAGSPASTTPLGVPVVDVAPGVSHTCAVTLDGGAYCWGTQDDVVAPDPAGSGVPFPPFHEATRVGLGDGGFRSDWRSVCSGRTHACALNSANELWCWGNGTKLGVEGPTTRVPQRVGTATYASMSCGADHTCAIRQNGGMDCFGDNNEGQLGDGTFQENAAVRAVTNPRGPADAGPGMWLEVASGAGATACGVRREGSENAPYCWGNNAWGQINGVPTTVFRPQPVAGVSAPGSNSMTASEHHVCLLDGFGNVQCWGDNRAQQTMPGGRQLEPLPVYAQRATPDAGLSWSTIATGPAHSCAVATPDGTNQTLRCWGSNDNGRLGSAVQTTVADTSRMGLSQLALGPTYTVLRSSDVLDYVGVLDGTTDQATFVELQPQLVMARQVAAGPYGLWATSMDSPPLLWSAAMWIPYFIMPVGELSQLHVGNEHACGVEATDRVACWGNYGTRALGGSLVDAGTFEFGIPVSGAGAVTSLCTGGYHSCAVAGGSLFCWGDNGMGQLGIGTQAGESLMARPVHDPDGGTQWNQVACGFNFTCATTADNVVHCWGNGMLGQLGNGLSLELAPIPFITTRPPNDGGVDGGG